MKHRPPLLIESPFRIGDRVYHRACQDNEPGIVAELRILPGCNIYQVTWGDKSQTAHYAFELSLEWEPTIESDDNEDDD